jgi:hypothetical protein
MVRIPENPDPSVSVTTAKPTTPPVKPSSIAYRIAVSALTHATLINSSAITAAYVVGFSNPVSIAIVVIALLTLVPIKRLIYEGSLLHTLAHNKYRSITGKNADWFHNLKNPDGTDSKIYLGGQPYLNWGHHEKLKGMRILSLLEPHEFYPSLFSEPVKSEDWQKLGNMHKVIVTPDFNPLKQEFIDDGVAFVEDAVAANEDVYTHCKAGKGRSAAIKICYFIKNFPVQIKSVDDAIAHVKKDREVININKGQRVAIDAYFTRIRA